MAFNLTPYICNASKHLKLNDCNGATVGEPDGYLVHIYGSQSDFDKFAAEPVVQDLLATSQSVQGCGDLLYVTQIKEGKVLVVFLRNHQSLNSLVQTSLHVPIVPDVGWSFFGDSDDQYHQILTAYKSFRSWIGKESLMLCSLEDESERTLTVKLNESSLWLARFPLSLFVQLHIGEFNRYRNVEWIVSNKTFSQHFYEKNVIGEELSDITTFLSKTVIILNTYSEHYCETKLSHATQSIVELLCVLRDVSVTDCDSPLHLRWYLNPSGQEIRQIFANVNTQYIFANFEASSSVWETGEGTRLAWNEQSPIKAFRQRVEVDCELSHVRLLRVFHCNSAFDAYDDEIAPASENTIVRKLLDSGAWRVEGGMTQELYSDYLKSLEALFFENAALEFVIRLKSIEYGLDSTQIRKGIRQALSGGGQ
jgi:hypothetical protein